MNSIPVSSTQPGPSVPSIQIMDADSTLLEGGEIFTPDMFTSIYDVNIYSCPQGLQPDYPSHPSQLDEVAELSHLMTPSSMYLTGQELAYPYPSIIQENVADGRLSPSSLGSPIPSPSPSSYAPSLSPASFYELALSDTDSPLSPSPTALDDFWPAQASSPYAGSYDSAVSTDSVCPQGGPQRPRSHSSPSTRRGPVASKAMLEANGRRRRHPAQFECNECKQTFTALFSLKRHQQSHTGERPFVCSIAGCGQRFFNSSDCKRHEKSQKRHKSTA